MPPQIPYILLLIDAIFVGFFCLNFSALRRKHGLGRTIAVAVLTLFGIACFDLGFYALALG